MAVAVAVCASALTLMASPASANTLYPSGCKTGAYGTMEYPTNGAFQFGDWDSNCYVGFGYVTSANFVTAVQRLVRTNGYGCTANGIDGGFGNNTQNGVYCYQEATQSLTGLGPDGRVGPKTWRDLGYHTLYRSYDDGTYEHYNLFDGFNTEEFAHVMSCPGGPTGCSWFVLSPSGAYNFMDVNGP